MLFLAMFCVKEAICSDGFLVFGHRIILMGKMKNRSILVNNRYICKILLIFNAFFGLKTWYRRPRAEAINEKHTKLKLAAVL